VNLKIGGVDFVANLNFLESKGIDVILGMDWLRKHKVLIDCQAYYPGWERIGICHRACSHS
jgi:hypothetical protein